MPKLIAFLNISLDGFISGENEDMSWFHAARADPEFAAFTSENASGGGRLLFGRVTYEMMASFWPTPAAYEQMPIVAKGMNESSKFVFSRTLKSAPWTNTTLLKGDLVEEVRRLKAAGLGIATLGSGSIVTQLSAAGLVDEWQFVLHPVALGRGKRLFEGLAEPVPMKLARTRCFANGRIALSYEKAHQ